MEVELVRWPSERERRERLREAGLPRLLLVVANAPAPSVVDVLEDWVRLPVDGADLRARAENLATRAERFAAGRPRVDDSDLLRFAGRQVPLPPLEARLARALTEHFGAVTARDALVRVGWPEVAPGRNSLDVHMLRLRRRIEPIGLSVRTVRSRGYLLEAASAGVPFARLDG
jgi:DNA-binding response OmpR family regulator